MFVLTTGALAGLFHVLSGPDHLAAVAPLALTARRRGWMAGWSWGVGHTSGVVAVAAAAVLARDLLPPVEAISAAGERLVGGVLVAVGLWTFGRAGRLRAAPHVHGAVAHDHLHVQAGPAWVRRLGHAHASFCLGVLHGIAGSSHFVGVLPALALPTRESALAYVAAFGVGTVAAMTVFAALVGAAALRTSPGARAHRAMLRSAAALAIVTGIVWLFAPA